MGRHTSPHSRSYILQKSPSIPKGICLEALQTREEISPNSNKNNTKGTTVIAHSAHMQKLSLKLKVNPHSARIKPHYGHAILSTAELIYLATHCQHWLMHSAMVAKSLLNTLVAGIRGYTVRHMSQHTPQTEARTNTPDCWPQNVAPISREFHQYNIAKVHSSRASLTVDGMAAHHSPLVMLWLTNLGWILVWVQNPKGKIPCRST